MKTMTQLLGGHYVLEEDRGITGYGTRRRASPPCRSTARARERPAGLAALGDRRRCGGGSGAGAAGRGDAPGPRRRGGTGSRIEADVGRRRRRASPGLTAALDRQARRPLGGRARGAVAGRRAGRRPSAGERRVLRARRDVRRPDAGPRARARSTASGSAPSRPTTRARTSTSTAASARRSATPGSTGSAPPDPLILPELIATVARLDQMSTSVPVDAPWTAANAAEWDAQTLAGYDRRRTRRPSASAGSCPAATRPIFGAEPRELSLLFVLFYIAASGNESNPGTFERNFNTRDGAQERRVEGGSQRARPGDGARRSASAGSCKRSPVRRIVQRRGRRHGSSADRGRRQREARDRRDPADPRRADRLPPRAAGGPRRAHPAARPGRADEGRGRPTRRRSGARRA